MTKEIQLTKGFVALVDDDDYERVSLYKWCYHRMGYACRAKGKKIVMMHRFILNDEDVNNDLDIDHKNRNGLDNRKENLHFCTRQENQKNRGFFKNNKSGYKGVYFEKSKKRWRAQITIDGKTINIGRAKNPEDASILFNNFIKTIEK